MTKYIMAAKDFQLHGFNPMLCESPEDCIDFCVSQYSLTHRETWPDLSGSFEITFDDFDCDAEYTFYLVVAEGL